MIKMAPFGHSNTNNNKSLPLVEFAQNNWLVWFGYLQLIPFLL